jgi:membrane protein insertase Oxa1/YidC/SpoIIIJ
MISEVSLYALFILAFIIVFIFVLLKMFSLPRNFNENEEKRQEIRGKQLEFNRHLNRVKEHYKASQPEKETEKTAAANKEGK